MRRAMVTILVCLSITMITISQFSVLVSATEAFSVSHVFQYSSTQQGQQTYVDMTITNTQGTYTRLTIQQYGIHLDWQDTNVDWLDNMGCPIILNNGQQTTVRVYFTVPTTASIGSHSFNFDINYDYYNTYYYTSNNNLWWNGATQSPFYVTEAPDTTNPSITIASPSTSSTYTTTSNTISIGGTATDNKAVTEVRWESSNGGSGTCTGTTSWSKTGITLSEGSNVITVKAYDAAFNTGTDTLTVTYTVPVTADTTNPTITITSPTSSSTYSTTSNTVNIAGTASDNVAVTQVDWSNNMGGSGTCTGTNSWSKNGIILYQGSNVITVTAYDAASNTKTDTLTITYTPTAPGDATNPTITITSAITSSNSVNIAGTASDNVAVTQVTWSNNKGGSGICSGTTYWSQSTIILYEGVNIITVTAYDAASNRATDAVTITYTVPDDDANPPVTNPPVDNTAPSEDSLSNLLCIGVIGLIVIIIIVVVIVAFVSKPKSPVPPQQPPQWSDSQYPPPPSNGR